MCGIAGFFDLGSRDERPDGAVCLARQIHTVSYRGPDAKAVWNGPGVGLAHARLAIIDLSSDANQPMASPDGQITVAFNGEIYNFLELRSELEAKGWLFRTRSDTEVLVAGYQVWGVEVVHRLRGMFAIALYDRRRDQLVLYRDRVGKKPLVYAIVNGLLVFGSEIKTILAWPGARREADLAAIDAYLTYQYVPSPMTAFTGIAKLAPGHLIVVGRGQEVVQRRYFDWPRPESAQARPEAELQDELVDRLREATRLRMISDVPIGAFLSGGVDSSAVVAMMAMQSSRPIKTFTIGFNEAKYDERAYARMVAERYGTDHEEFVVEPHAMDVLDDLVYYYNEPFADSSAIPTFYVAQAARRQVTVVLNGDGGDEAFLGYARYKLCRQLQAIDDRMPLWMARGLYGLARISPRGLDGLKIIRHARQVLSNRFQRPSHRYETFIAYFTHQSKQSLYSGAMRAHLAASRVDSLDEYFDAAPTLSWGAQWADLHTYLPDDLLVKVDIASMASSLESRSPFLDHDFLAWACTIPEQQRFAGGEPKSLLKGAMEPYLPREVLYRPKMGFGVPIDAWLRTEMRDFAYDMLTGGRASARGLFDMAQVRRLLDRHNAGENWATRIWALLMLELWYRVWIDPVEALSHPTAQRLGGSRGPVEQAAFAV
ncbi:asparagine synthase (glutamine-hydrolyzing) [Phreatobacter stygius]|uniref:asparagine synthase (glutamine-hydrolyzing) n=1 Tax=Phreatobacter stygius TaxID=1940610 RepID=A0A4D7B0C6_9HYPH|nr:asparagine synthase (glutamine-hydrolyzing) [Phreatobacter stygius]QCI63470.1 asparagine synthase (glutamine-hydrolyzing) [Phreatobacter stygius]